MKKEDNIKIILNSVSKTNKLANKLAKKLKAGTTILLSGDLGAGKTTFTKALFKSFGVKEPVTSPTFTIIREYKGKNNINLYHFDMYRINDDSELNEIGFFDYINNPNAIVVIEWYEKIEKSLKGKFIKININKLNENKREFEIIKDYIL